VIASSSGTSSSSSCCSNSSSSSYSGSISGCPGWFRDYVVFHQKYRGQPNATYLVADCSIGGVGDRLNGALTALRMAAALKRIVLLRSHTPFPLEELFEPAGPVNWTTRGLQLPRSKIR
jgi:hypothetical protein